jgi:CHASE2 domain-containing sensor protein
MRKGSPGELFSAAIATIQNQTFIRRVPGWGATLVLIAVALVAYRVPRMSRLKAIGAGAGTLVVFVLVALAAFNRWLVWIPIVPVLGAVLFMVLYRIVTPDSAGKPKRPVIL